MQGSKMGVRTTSIRLAPYVYSDDGAAFSKIQEGKAMERGVSAYVNAGTAFLLLPDGNYLSVNDIIRSSRTCINQFAHIF